MKTIITILILLLIGSNLSWLYSFIYAGIDSGVTISYHKQQYTQMKKIQDQFIQIIPDIAKGLSKKEIISTISKYSKEDSFEKNGCIWIGDLGFKFDNNDKLIAVVPGYSYGENDPCY